MKSRIHSQLSNLESPILNPTATLALFSLCLFALTARATIEVVNYSLNGGDVAASHIILVPFVTAVLIYSNRRKIFERARFSPISGAITVLVGLGVMGIGWGWGHTLGTTDRLALMTVATVVTWIGGFLLSYGPSAFRQALFPLLFLAFCVPIPTPMTEAVITILQRASAETAFLLLKMTGTPVYREGFIFAMPNLVIEIAPECSGIRSGIGMFIVSLVAGYLFLSSWWKRGILAIAAILIGILKNAIRIDTLSLLTIHVDPGIIEGRLHHDGGVLFFAMGLLLVYPVLMLLVRLERRPDHLREVTR